MHHTGQVGLQDMAVTTEITCLLSRETLNCGEITVFHAAKVWARAECGRREVEPTAENMR